MVSKLLVETAPDA